jgi:hypothetical protein
MFFGFREEGLAIKTHGLEILGEYESEAYHRHGWYLRLLFLNLLNLILLA